MRTIIQAIDGLMAVVGAIASTLLILLVLVMSYNVLAGFALKSETIGLAELSWHLYAAVFLLGIPAALKSGAHVRVDVLFEKFEPKTKVLIDLIGTVLFLIPTCLVVIWAGWHFTAAAYQLGVQPSTVTEFFSQLVNGGIGEKSQDPGGLLNRWIIKGVIPLSFCLLLLAAISMLLDRCFSFSEQFSNKTTNNSDEQDH